MDIDLRGWFSQDKAGALQGRQRSIAQIKPLRMSIFYLSFEFSIIYNYSNYSTPAHTITRFLHKKGGVTPPTIRADSLISPSVLCPTVSTQFSDKPKTAWRRSQFEQTAWYHQAFYARLFQYNFLTNQKQRDAAHNSSRQLDIAKRFTLDCFHAIFYTSNKTIFWCLFYL